MATRATMALDYSATPPAISNAKVSTWITRGANFVVATSKLRAGAVLKRTETTDESMVLVVTGSARITAGGESVEAGSNSLTIMPPGSGSIEASADALIVQIFSHLAAELLPLAENAAAYADGAPDVAPLVAWPDPTEGFALRHYQVGSFPTMPKLPYRMFRCANLMVALVETPVPRDTARLSPHSHDDFEQASLSLDGRFLHHCRYPWSADLSEWRDDEHHEVGSPSMTVIPPNVIHTSHNTTGPAWLLDIFAPPRLDFSLMEGAVKNGDEYSMPESKQTA